MLDTIIHVLPKTKEPESLNLPRFAVVGRPNAGKSSFINALLGKERNIVTDQAGTTRDSIDTILINMVLSLSQLILLESEKNQKSRRISNFTLSFVRCDQSSIRMFVWYCLMPQDPLTVRSKIYFG